MSTYLGVVVSFINYFKFFSILISTVTNISENNSQKQRLFGVIDKFQKGKEVLRPTLHCRSGGHSWVRSRLLPPCLDALPSHRSSFHPIDASTVSRVTLSGTRGDASKTWRPPPRGTLLRGRIEAGNACGPCALRPDVFRVSEVRASRSLSRGPRQHCHGRTRGMAEAAAPGSI